MKRILQTSLFCACAAWAQPAQVVVPGGLADVEGNSSSADLFINGTARMLQVYSASEFNFGAPALRIDAVAFRFESGTEAFVGSWSVTMGLSTTTRSPDSLSPVFDENVGVDEIMVRGGPLGIFALDTGVSPRPFELRVSFTTPFIYDPTRGNLAINMIASGTRVLVMDSQFASDDTVGRVLGEYALSGMTDSLGLVTRFDITLIPEPLSIRIMAIAAIALLIVVLTRARHQRFAGPT